MPCAACDRYVYNKVLCPGEWSAPISVSKLASSDVSIRKQREIHQGMMRRVSIAYKKLSGVLAYIGIRHPDVDYKNINAYIHTDISPTTNPSLESFPLFK